MSCLFGLCVAAVKLMDGGTYIESTPKHVIDTANVVHDISSFYQVKNTQFNVNGYLILDSDTRIDFGFDNGLKSQKRNRSQALKIGFTQLNRINERSYLTYGMSSKLGGKTTETPCRDESGMERLFHCDNLSTLEPFKQPDRQNPLKVSLKFIHNF